MNNIYNNIGVITVYVIILSSHHWMHRFAPRIHGSWASNLAKAWDMGHIILSYVHL